jgi:hypothetical protein
LVFPLFWQLLVSLYSMAQSLISFHNYDLPSTIDIQLSLTKLYGTDNTQFQEGTHNSVFFK